MGLTKPKCLGAFASTKSVRKYGLARASQFLTRFPWFSFLLQAPQALYSLTGYGLILGSVMGAITDFTWGAVRAATGNKVELRGPPPSDPVSKAARYLSQGPVHMAASEALTFEDHYLLLAADVVATGIIMQNFRAADLLPRLDLVAAAPVVTVEPWNPATVGALQSFGWAPGGEQVPFLPELGPTSTYVDMVQAYSNLFPSWIDSVARDFPVTFSSTAFMAMLMEAGADVFTWASGGEQVTRPIFDPEELVIARCFEFGIFPPGDVSPEVVEVFVLRALQLAAARGRELPDRGDLARAAAEAWGSFVTS